MSLKKLIRRVLLGKDKAYQNYHEEENRAFVEAIRAQGGSVGKNFDIYDTYFDSAAPFLVSIGDNVTITGATVLMHDSSMRKFLRDGGYSFVAHITIGNDVFVGRGAILLPGTTIGSRVVIGAGSVVSGTVPDSSVVCGNPAKVICSFDEYIKKQETRLEQFPILHDGECSEERNREIAKEHGGFWLYRR